MSDFDFSQLARVNPDAIDVSAAIRQLPEYFQVDEVLPFKPDGTGGHVWLKIRKKNTNTDWVAEQLAKFSDVAQVAIGYAGLKDRHAVTSQWFSINLEGKTEPDWQQFESEELQIVEITRHGKKLKRGVLSGNYFTLRLTEMNGDKPYWQSRLEQIKQTGVPNYFAEQRFGHNGNNLQRVDYWFKTGKAPKKRNQRSIYLSAARSWLFNLVLAKRVETGDWNRAVDGDLMLLSGTQASLFTAESSDTDIEKRVASMDIHPTGPLWGRGESAVKTDSLDIETAVLVEWLDWRQGLEKAGLKQQRRSLRLFAQDFEWQFLDDQQLELHFFLPSGCYATAVLRELADVSDASRSKLQERVK